MAGRRFDIQTESAQARWARRRSSTPPAPVSSSNADSVEESKATESAAGADTALNGLYDVKRRPSLLAPSHRRTSSGPPASASPLTLPSPKPQPPPNPAMQAIKLQRKYPQVSQEEMFALIEKFK